MLLDFRVHSDARVAHSEHDVRTRLDGDMSSDIFIVQVDIRCFNGEFAALWHRITRIDRQIQDDLFDLSGVCFDGSQVWRENGAELDIFADNPEQDLFYSRNDRVKAQGRRLQDL